MFDMMMAADRPTGRKAGYRTCLPPLHHCGHWRQAVPKICSVDGCGGVVDWKGLCPKHRHRLRLTGTTDPGPRAHLPLEERFWKFVAKAGPDDCWLWTGTKAKQGYGYIAGGARAKGMRAHRVSWEIANGRQAPDDMFVLHSCDNPSCVNPAHLSLGTRAENTADMLAKGRQRNGVNVGAANGSAVLTPGLVRYIRASEKSSYQLAQELGVGKSTIRRVRSGENWSHVT